MNLRERFRSFRGDGLRATPKALALSSSIATSTTPAPHVQTVPATDTKPIANLTPSPQVTTEINEAGSMSVASPACTISLATTHFLNPHGEARTIPVPSPRPEAQTGIIHTDTSPDSPIPTEVFIKPANAQASLLDTSSAAQSSTTDLVPKPTPEFTLATSSYESPRTWKCLDRFRCVLSGKSGGLGHLKSAIDDFAECISIHADTLKSRQDYATLKTELEELFSVLSEHFSGVPPAMTAGMKNLCSTIGSELDRISTKEARGRTRRYLESKKDLEDIMGCYQRIHNHLERLKINSDMSMWRIVDELAAENRLKPLSLSKAARYNSAESLQIGRRECTPETRKQVLSCLDTWIHQRSQENVFWLNGMAGTGKTTIASSLCAILDKSHELGASFFCSRVLPECRNVNLILPTIAYQLARYSRPFYHAISLALREDPDLHTKVLPSQFEGLVIGPLRRVAHALPAGIVIVIDALDECEDSHGVGLFLEILSNCALNLPIKIFVSSRPEPQIRQNISGTSSRLILHELEHSIVKEDIRLYLQTELVGLLTFVSDADLATVVEHAGVLFIYAATIVRYIKTVTSPTLRQRRLHSMLAAGTPGYANTTQDIDALYNTILASAFEDSKLEDAEKAIMTLVLHTVVCAQELLTTGALAGLLGLDDGSWVQAALEPLWSVVHMSGADGVVTTLHASFTDYMLDPVRSRDYSCRSEQHHGRLAGLCFDRLKANKPQFNICGLGSSFIADENVYELESRVKRAVPQELLYACRYWVEHTEKGGPSVALLEQLEQLVSERLLLWMEVLNLTKNISSSRLILSRARAWCQRINAPQEIQSLIHEAWRFATMFASGEACRSTPHLYMSMLASWPGPGPLKTSYIPRSNGLVKVEGTGMERRQLALLSALGVGSAVQSVAFSPNGTRIVSGSDDGIVRVWDATDGNLIMDSLKGHESQVMSVAFSPDGIRIASGSADHTIRVWDAMNGRLILNPLRGHTDWVWSVAFSPDGMHIASGSFDNTILVWDAASGKPVMGPLTGHTKSVNSIVFSPDGTRIFSGSFDYTVRIWDAVTGKPIIGPLEGHTNSVNSVAFSFKCMRIFSGSDDNTIRLWDATNGQSLMNPLEGHTWSVSTVVCSPDGTQIISGSGDNTIRVWDAMTGKPIRDPLEGHTGSISSAAYSPDGTCIISGSTDRTICIWDAASHQGAVNPLEGHTRPVNSLSFSPDGAYIVFGSSDNSIRIWDAASGRLVKSLLGGQAGMANSIVFSPDGTRIACGYLNNSVCIWDAASGKRLVEPLKGHTWRVNSVAFSPNGMRIVSGSDDKTIRVWEVMSGKPIMNPLIGHKGSVNSISFSPNGIHIATGSDDNTIRLWDIVSGESIMGPIEGHIGRINSVAYSPDGTRIISGSYDRTIRVWDAASGKAAMKPLEGHSWSVNSVAFSRDGTRIVSGSNDNTIRVWDALTGKPVIEPLKGHTNAVNAVAFAPNCKHIVSGSVDNTIRVWDISKLDSYNSDPQVSWSLDENGWVVDSQGRLLLWLPADLRHRLLRPHNTLLISTKGSVELDFEGANIGESWTKAYLHA